MLWQSAAIAAGFGTMYQYSKRKISAMSNEEFNKTDPIQFINESYQNITRQIPSSLKHMDSINIAMLDSMNRLLDQAVKYIYSHITGGNLDEFGEGIKLPAIPGITTPLIPPAHAEPSHPELPPIKPPIEQVPNQQSKPSRYGVNTYKLSTLNQMPFSQLKSLWITEKGHDHNNTPGSFTKETVTLIYALYEQRRLKQDAAPKKTISHYADDYPVPTRKKEGLPKRRRSNSSDLEYTIVKQNVLDKYNRFFANQSLKSWKEYIFAVQKLLDFQYMYGYL